MSISALNHYNISAPASLLEQVRDFYCNVMGLHCGPRPAFRSKGYWLYADNHDVIHLTETTVQADSPGNEPKTTGYFNHIAFTCNNLEETMKHLDALRINYQKYSIQDLNQVQLFFTDPAGISVELNFTNGR